MRRVVRLLRLCAAVLICPPLALLAASAFAACDVVWILTGRRRATADRRPDTSAASIVIPNWNGQDLLARYLPSVVAAAAGNPRNEVIVVDNGSSDGSAEFVSQAFPTVKVVALDENLGFGGGSNAGFHAARNDVVVLLNSDMRVDEGFLQPLLDGFTDEKVFAVSCQIFFSDPAKKREETGLTQGSWRGGALRVRHRIDPEVRSLFPCFYGGGGSCAFDRRKFLEFGGFDPLLAPFYLEDTDLGYMAWKRGWKVLYQPLSTVFHEHRGTIGRKFSRSYIDGIVKKNFLLFSWKNIHDWRKLSSHFLFTIADCVLTAAAGPSPERATTSGFLRAARQLPRAMASRWRARTLAVVDDNEAFARPLGGYFRDRFHSCADFPERLSVLFLSPYPIYPPVHGGGVFMYQTVRRLADLTRLHLVSVLDYTREIQAHFPVDRLCASAEHLVRPDIKSRSIASIRPHAVREIANPELEWIIHRKIFTEQIDVIQLEYTSMAQYAGNYRNLACVLFEHDVYFQSIARGAAENLAGLRGVKTGLEYLRALRYELRALPRMDHVQVCTRENKQYLLEFLPELHGRIDDDTRAGIETSDYRFRLESREANTMLFLGSFRHLPNREALDWFLRHVLPVVAAKCPEAKLVVIGAEPPPAHSIGALAQWVELRGFVENIREPLERYAVFVCPILSGSGVRVKLLEAFASGIPVVSTRLGAEGLASTDGDVCAIADDPAQFAERILELFANPDRATDIAIRARRLVSEQRDVAVMTERLVDNYRAILIRKRGLQGASRSIVQEPEIARR